MSRVRTEDLRTEMMFVTNSIISDERQIDVVQFQLDLMRKELVRKRAKLARLRGRWKRAHGP